jgi:cobalt-precorrin-5B (C1)-methyltransferase
MEEYFDVKKNKELRCGYTTGSCAAAAAKAACMILFDKMEVKTVSIDTPKGIKLEIDINIEEQGDSFVKCYVVKDAGDDPDVTNGIKIFARAERTKLPGIEISGGAGIGVVTRKGLSVEPGKPAINPVPMKMIIEEIKKVIDEKEGVKIEISAPEGVEIAKKTFNPKLGIVGGISIIGTTGIVEPMSEEAFKNSLALKISVLKEEGIKNCIFTPGNIGEKFLINDYEYRVDENRIIIISNFLGFMLEKAVYYGMKKILFAGHIGKLIKPAGGIFHTHSRVADARNEILAANYGYFCNDLSGVKKIMESNTTEEAIDHIKDEKFFSYIACKIKKKCESHVYNKLAVEVVLISQFKGKLAETGNALSLIMEIEAE